MRNQIRAASLLLTALAAAALHLSGQTDRDQITTTAPAQSAVRWYHIGAGLGVAAASALLDESLRESIQRNRSGTGDDVARAFRRMGEPLVFGTVGVGTLLAGVIAHDKPLTRAGARISAGLLTAGAVAAGLKLAVGRRRPGGPSDNTNFKPFSSQDSWPSGHTTMAFALATGVSDEIHELPVTILLYGAAGMTGWSRLNDDRHWLSDVLTGAMIGITGAKLANGRWRVLGVRAPKVLLEPDGVGMSMAF